MSIHSCDYVCEGGEWATKSDSTCSQSLIYIQVLDGKHWVMKAKMPLDSSETGYDRYDRIEYK